MADENTKLLNFKYHNAMDGFQNQVYFSGGQIMPFGLIAKLL